MVEKELTEIFIKNVIAEYCNQFLKGAIKSEHPDFVTNRIGLEVTTLTVEEIARAHSHYEIYKGCNIDKIPNSVFKSNRCEKSNLIPLSFGGYGIKNSDNELRFVFDNNKVFIAFFHREIIIPQYLEMLKATIYKKQSKLNKGYTVKELNYLGILVPDNFLDVKSKRTIGIVNKEWLDYSITVFDIIYIVFANAIVENDIKNGNYKVFKIPEGAFKKIMDDSKKELVSLENISK